MSLPRRNFLIRGAAAILLAGIPLAASRDAFAQKSRRLSVPQQPGVPIPAEAQAAPIFYMNKSTFEAHLNTLFNVQYGLADDGVQIRLIEIRDVIPEAEKARAKSLHLEAFALEFRGSRRDPIKQDTYTFKHDSLGTFELFIVPVGDDKKFLYYEAVINRLH
jgi:hypothetical protein